MALYNILLSLILSLHAMIPKSLFFFFFNDTATTEIYTLSLHDALPISRRQSRRTWRSTLSLGNQSPSASCARSEEHTSELQSRPHLVCRLLLEKKKKKLRPGRVERVVSLRRRARRRKSTSRLTRIGWCL